MSIFGGDFIIRTGLGGARSLMKVTGGVTTTIATVSADEAGDMVLMAVRRSIAQAGGRLTDEATEVVLAGSLAEMIA